MQIDYLSTDKKSVNLEEIKQRLQNCFEFLKSESQGFVDENNFEKIFNEQKSKLFNNIEKISLRSTTGKQGKKKKKEIEPIFQLGGSRKEDEMYGLSEDEEDNEEDEVEEEEEEEEEGASSASKIFRE